MLAYGFKSGSWSSWSTLGSRRRAPSAWSPAGAGSKSPACGLPGLAGGRSRSFDGPDPQARLVGAFLVTPVSPGQRSPHRCRQFLGDCNNFLASSENWAERATALGWVAVALFGCRRNHPLLHLGNAGLLWAINGGRPVELHRDRALIELAVDGSRRVFHRRHVDAVRRAHDAVVGPSAVHPCLLWPENPMVRTFPGCCAHAASGHATAAPPRSVMHWRRLMSSMGSPPEPAVPAYRRLRMPRKRPQVLGVDLNRSESKPPAGLSHAFHSRRPGVVVVSIDPGRTVRACRGLPG